MAIEFYPIHGTALDPGELILSKASSFAQLVYGGHYPFVRATECLRTENGHEIIVFEVDVQRPQHPVNDISYNERIAVTFFRDDNRMPEVEALRKSFPSVPHLNLRSAGAASLCLYEEGYEEVKIHWTAFRFLERIRMWLADTALGTLHRDDQPLEPFLSPQAHRIILPPEFFENSAPEQMMQVVGRAEGNSLTLFAFGKEEHVGFDVESPQEAVLLSITADVQKHGLLHHTPNTLGQLQALVEPIALNLVEHIKGVVKGWHEGERLKENLHKSLVLLVRFPMLRNSNDRNIEAVGTWAFHLPDKIADLGQSLGIWEIHDGHIGLVLGNGNNAAWESLPIGTLNVVKRFCSAVARVQNGTGSRENSPITLIGAGAIGSGIFNSLIRAGFEDVTVIDEDTLLPHNLARHTLDYYAVGVSKARALATLAQLNLGNHQRFSGIHDDVICPRRDKERVASALQSAKIIIDASASIPVARHLASLKDCKARVASCFIAPNGKDMVLLTEPEDKAVTIDCLEHQYYRHIIERRSLQSHMVTSVSQNRYGRTCRDFSVTLPNDVVTVHAAIAAAALKGIQDITQAGMTIWQLSDNYEISRLDLPVSQQIEELLPCGWRVVFDQHILDKMEQQRCHKAPAETGGVLVGSHDTSRKTVYVTDSLIAPSDSKGSARSFVRGADGVKEALQQIRTRTLDRVYYIGEWHTHGSLDSPEPSSEDMAALAEIATVFRPEGLPAVMMIKASSGFRVLLDG